MYKKPCALLIAVEDDYPQFGLLQGIYVVDNNRVLFRVRLCATEGFDSHQHVFTILCTSMYRLVKIEELTGTWTSTQRYVHCTLMVLLDSVCYTSSGMLKSDRASCQFQ